AIHQIAKTNSLRHCKAQSRVRKGDSFVRRGNADCTCAVDWAAIRRYCLNVRYRRRPALSQVRWINHRKATTYRKPDPSGRIGDYRPASVNALATGKTVCRAVLANIGCPETATNKLVSAYLENMVCGRDPKRSIAVFCNSEYLFP